MREGCSTRVAQPVAELSNPEAAVCPTSRTPGAGRGTHPGGSLMGVWADMRGRGLDPNNGHGWGGKSRCLRDIKEVETAGAGDTHGGSYERSPLFFQILLEKKKKCFCFHFSGDGEFLAYLCHLFYN